MDCVPIDGRRDRETCGFVAGIANFPFSVTVFKRCHPERERRIAHRLERYTSVPSVIMASIVRFLASLGMTTVTRERYARLNPRSSPHQSNFFFDRPLRPDQAGPLVNAGRRATPARFPGP